MNTTNILKVLGPILGLILFYYLSKTPITSEAVKIVAQVEQSKEVQQEIATLQSANQQWRQRYDSLSQVFQKCVATNKKAVQVITKLETVYIDTSGIPQECWELYRSNALAQSDKEYLLSVVDSLKGEVKYLDDFNNYMLGRPQPEEDPVAVTVMPKMSYNQSIGVSTGWICNDWYYGVTYERRNGRIGMGGQANYSPRSGKFGAFLNASWNF